MNTHTQEHAQFDIRTETKHFQSYTPHVIEPSFGIDRVFTAVLEHSYYSRPQVCMCVCIYVCVCIYIYIHVISAGH